MGRNSRRGNVTETAPATAENESAAPTEIAEETTASETVEKAAATEEPAAAEETSAAPAAEETSAAPAAEETSAAPAAVEPSAPPPVRFTFLRLVQGDRFTVRDVGKFERGKWYRVPMEMGRLLFDSREIFETSRTCPASTFVDLLAP